MPLTVGRLIDQLKEMPADALVYIEADHGQCPEQAGEELKFSIDEGNFPYADSDGVITWLNIDKAPKVTGITAILIQ